jgi:hypothetical protein
MWHNNRLVQQVYVVHNPQGVWAVIEAVAGWKRVRPGAADGVTNLGVLLSAAKANNRRVHVDIVGNEIIRAVLL